MKATNCVGSSKNGSKNGVEPVKATHSLRGNTAGEVAKVPNLRRRLTISSQCGELPGVGPSTASTSSTTTVTSPEQARALIKTLKETDVLSIVHEDGPYPAEKGANYRRLSISTATDITAAARRRSFLEKKATVEGVENQQSAIESLASMGIGTACKKGKKPESPNQDSFSVVIVEDKFKLYAVFDGHGACGHDVSNFCRDSIIKLFLRNPKRDDQPEQALAEAFVESQKLLESLSRRRDGDRLDCSTSGTTCTVVYQPVTVTPPTLILAHVGDSRAVLAQKRGGKLVATDLTEDHKPDIAVEKARIEKAGGTVAFDGHFNHRVFTKDGQGGLNMSRALGDITVSKVGVSSVPETSTVPLSVSKVALEEDMQDELMLILCSDGVWEFIESDEAAQIVDKFGKDRVQEATEYLAKTAWDRWMADSGDEISDDITAIIAYLP
jgi:serine/threonine protein phosphatase PrpC